MQFQTCSCKGSKEKKAEVTRALYFFSGGEVKTEYDKVVDEYFWPVTQAVGWSCCGHSGATVLELGFQLDFFVYTYGCQRYIY